MRVVISGVNLPGRAFCRPDGTLMDNVHVGVQVGRAPFALVPADRAEARWEIEIQVREDERGVDFRGPAVEGRRGDRFVYLTWGHVGPAGGFEMFRRAKLMLDRVDPTLMGAGVTSGGLAAEVDLTGSDGGPRCARVDPPAITWSVISGP